MLLNALIERLKRRSKDDFKGRSYEAKRNAIRSDAVRHIKSRSLQILTRTHGQVTRPLCGFRSKARFGGPFAFLLPLEGGPGRVRTSAGTASSLLTCLPEATGTRPCARVPVLHPLD